MERAVCTEAVYYRFIRARTFRSCKYYGGSIKIKEVSFSIIQYYNTTSFCVKGGRKKNLLFRGHVPYKGGGVELTKVNQIIYLGKCTETFDLSAASASNTDNSCCARFRYTFLQRFNIIKIIPQKRAEGGGGVT